MINCFLFSLENLPVFGLFALTLLILVDLIVNQLTFIKIFFILLHFWLMMERKFDNEFSFSSFNNCHWEKLIFFYFYLAAFFPWFILILFLFWTIQMDSLLSWSVVAIMTTMNQNWDRKFEMISFVKKPKNWGFCFFFTLLNFAGH